jgi:transposase InsO family protein
VKLNNKKLKYIINQKKKGVSSAKLTAIYRVSTRYINKIYYNYINYNKTELYKTGRKTKVIDEYTEELIIRIRTNHLLIIDNTIETLVHAIELYGKPLEILTDHGTQFFSNGKNGIPGDHNKFQEYLDNNNIKHILAKVDHPQTNGKLERLTGTVKPLKPYFSTWEEVVYYYNYKRRHMRKIETS